MPQAIAYAISFAATAISNAVTLAAYELGAGAAVQGAIGATVYYVAELGIYVGLAEALQPKVPKPETGLLTIKQSVPVRRRGFGEYRTGGELALWEAKEDFAFQVVMVHDGEIDSFQGFWLNDDEVTVIGGVVQTGADGRYPSPQVKIQTRLGVVPETAYADLVAALPGYWTTNHRGDGIASISLSCQNGKLVHQYRNFPNGEPSVSSKIRAQKCYDPRDEAQDPGDRSTWVWSKNPALCLLTYLMRERGYAYDWDADENDTYNPAGWARSFAPYIDRWIRGANVCDEDVDLDAGGTEKRYEIGGQYELDQDETAVINNLLNSCDGWLARVGGGGWVFDAGEFVAPSVTLTAAHILAISIQKGVERENRVNQIVATYTDPAKAYNTAEADPWNDDEAITAAGKPLPEELPLPWVQSHTRARRLAKRRMSRHSAAFRGVATVNLAGLALLGQRYLEIDWPVLSTLDGAIVEVTGNVTIDVTGLKASFPFIAVDPDARDGWTPADDEGEAPPPTESVPPTLLEAPTIEEAHAWFEDGSTPRISLTATGPDRADLTWDLRWKRTDLADWQPIETHDDVTDHPTATMSTGFVSADGDLEIQARVRTGGGLTSDWSASYPVSTTPPSPTFDSTRWRFDTTHITFDETA